MAGDPSQIHQDIAQEFLRYFYSKIQTTREELINLYTDNAMLSYEGQAFTGKQSILDKLKSLPKYSLNVSSCDCQFIESDATRLLILVTGTITLEQGQPMQFCHNFHLRQFNQSTWLITNELFRFSFLG
ncbi:unnamed protein product [Gordionus sp. m RMFG-2023]|uniref:uncharacterized protein LOC135924856 n=1 Tax=Gordionus sp. m RMFG-2023 TaxID=3053472 RepID=UPI0030DF61E0